MSKPCSSSNFLMFSNCCISRSLLSTARSSMSLMTPAKLFSRKSLLMSPIVLLMSAVCWFKSPTSLAIRLMMLAYCALVRTLYSSIFLFPRKSFKSAASSAESASALSSVRKWNVFCGEKFALNTVTACLNSSILRCSPPIWSLKSSRTSAKSLIVSTLPAA